MSIFLLLAIAVAMPLHAQQTDTTKKIKADTIKNRFLPTGLRIGTDLIALGKSQFQANFTGQEFTADVDFGRYFVTAEIGNWGRTFQSPEGIYTNDGNYWRAGVDVNFLLKDPERNMFFLGMRYAKSTFSDNLTVTVVDPLWGTLTENYLNTDVSARWFELTGGLKVKVWKFVWMGYTARFKFWLKSDETTRMIPHDIPGYGRTDGEMYWGFNYNLYFRIPFRKMPPLPPPKKKKSNAK